MKPKLSYGSPERREFLREIGRKGGRNNVAKHGPDHMAEIGLKGAESRIKQAGGMEKFKKEMGKARRQATKRQLEGGDTHE